MKTYQCVFQGMFGDYAVHALWTDTTTMNTDKAIPYSCHGNLDKYSFNCTHVPTAYGNNDSDNQVPGHSDACDAQAMQSRESSFAIGKRRR